MIAVCITTQGRRFELNRLLNSPAFWNPVLDFGARVRVLMQGGVFSLDDRDHNITVMACDLCSEAEARQRQVEQVIRNGLRPDDTLVFLNDDLQVIEPGWLGSLMAALTPGIAVSGAEGRIVTPDFYTRASDQLPGPVDYVGGGWCAVRGHVFLSGVQFDTRYDGTYWVDVDLCYQITQRRLGAIWGCGEIGLVHESASTTDQHGWQEINRRVFREKWG